ncbi:MAG: phospholipase A [Burkholderiales bacterium]
MLPLAAALWPDVCHGQLAACARIADPGERLACYDELARSESGGRAETPAPQSTKPPVRSQVVERAPVQGSAMQQHWELTPELKRGIFNLTPHRPLYGLVHWTSDVNAQPSSPTRPFDVAQPVDLDRAEGKIQLSFKTKAAEGLFGSPGDLWLGYSQVSYWQLGNQRQSSPFRETNYEPEATLMFPVDFAAGGLRMRFLGLTLNHQSNGRGGTLSRSWNRLIGEAGAEYGRWSFHFRPWSRLLASSGDDNDNPDIEDYAGRGEFIVAWRSQGHVVTATARHSLRFDERSRGSARLDWAFPLVGALNGHIQVFSGYGLNLIDYNHRQTTVGVGVSFLD